MTCDSFVQQFIFNPEEIEKFKKSTNKSTYYVGEKSLYECTSYPCQTCDKFMCKIHNFKKVKYFNNEKNSIYNASLIRQDIGSKDGYIKRFEKGRKTKRHITGYTWNVMSQGAYERELLINNNTGQTVYDMTSKPYYNLETKVSQCDIEALSIFNNIYYSF